MIGLLYGGWACKRTSKIQMDHPLFHTILRGSKVLCAKYLGGQGWIFGSASNFCWFVVCKPLLKKIQQIPLTVTIRYLQYRFLSPNHMKNFQEVVAFWATSTSTEIPTSHENDLLGRYLRSFVATFHQHGHVAKTPNLVKVTASRIDCLLCSCREGMLTLWATTYLLAQLFGPSHL